MSEDAVSTPIGHAVLVPVPTGAHGTEACVCACHIRHEGMAVSEIHDGGATCPCRLTPKERLAAFEQARAEIQAYWDSPEGLAELAREAAELAAARTVAEGEGMRFDVESQSVPVVLAGEIAVDGESFAFWFRERSGNWRVHEGSFHGEVLASGDTHWDDLSGLVLTLAPILRRAVRQRSCTHPLASAGDAYCRGCGVELAR